MLDPKDPTKVLVKAGEQVAGFAMLRDDGSTACGNWIYCGCWSQAGNLTARRDNCRSVRPRPDAELGLRLAGQPAHPLQPRLVPTWPASRGIRSARCCSWTGTAWGGNDVPDMRPDAAPDENVMPFIMNPEGVARLFAAR